MLRLIFFLIAAAALAWGVVWMSDNPGQVSFNWGGWQVETSAGVFGALAFVLIASVALAYRFWLFLTRAPGRIGGALKERRSQKGYMALTKGMVAVAAGDAIEAKRQVGKADGLLGEPPLTLLLKAQAAQLNGDESAAETFFKAMLDDPEMEFLGLRGLVNQAMKRDDDKQALEFARRAQALNPKSTWMADTLSGLEARTGHWDAAGAALARADKLKALPKAESKHHQAVAALAQSVNAQKANDDAAALKFAVKAVAQDPSLTPAALHLARLYVKDNTPRKARSVVEKAWKAAPHPDLMVLYFDARGAEDGMKKVTAAQTLLELNPTSADSHIAVAVAALEAKLWGQARTHLQSALDAGRATRTVFTLMARLEEEDRGDKDLAHSWLSRAAAAAADPAWVCTECGHVEAHWLPHCSKCQSFDSLTWKMPSGFEAPDLLDPDALKIEALPLETR